MSEAPAASCCGRTSLVELNRTISLIEAPLASCRRGTSVNLAYPRLFHRRHKVAEVGEGCRARRLASQTRAPATRGRRGRGTTHVRIVWLEPFWRHSLKTAKPQLRTWALIVQRHFVAWSDPCRAREQRAVGFRCECRAITLELDSTYDLAKDLDDLAFLDASLALDRECAAMPGRLGAHVCEVSRRSGRRRREDTLVPPWSALICPRHACASVT